MLAAGHQERNAPAGAAGLGLMYDAAKVRGEAAVVAPKGARQAMPKAEE